LLLVAAAVVVGLVVEVVRGVIEPERKQEYQSHLVLLP
jgi:hypothetical protein